MNKIEHCMNKQFGLVVDRLQTLGDSIALCQYVVGHGEGRTRECSVQFHFRASLVHVGKQLFDCPHAREVAAVAGFGG